MRAKLLPLVLVAGVSFAGASFAAGTDVSGTIKTIDSKAMTVTLEDGKVYQLPTGFKLDAFKVGEKVKITSETKAGKNDASAMVVAK